MLDAKPIELAPYGEAKFKFDPLLPPMRLALSLEQLRDRSDQILKKSVARPKDFPRQSGGTAADFTARATFAKSFFETGGIEAIDTEGFTDPAALAEAFSSNREPRWPASAPPTNSMPIGHWPPRRPFKLPAPGNIHPGRPAGRTGSRVSRRGR